MEAETHGKTDSTTGSAGRVLHRPAAPSRRASSNWLGGLVVKQGIGKFRHHFFEAAAEFERGNHRVERVAVARIDDALQNFHGFLLEFGEG